MLVLSVQAQPLAMHCQCSVHSSTGLWPALTVPVRASGRYLIVQCGPVRCAERARKPYRVQYVSTILLNMYKQLYRQSYKQSGRPTLSISIYLSADPDPCTARRSATLPPRAYIYACVGFGIRRSYHVGSHDVWLAVVPLLVVSRDNSASTVGRRNTCNSSCSASAR